MANIVTLGAFIKKTGLLKSENIEKAITDLFSGKKPELVEINIKALKLGMEKCSRSKFANKECFFCKQVLTIQGWVFRR